MDLAEVTLIVTLLAVVAFAWGIAALFFGAMG